MKKTLLIMAINLAIFTYSFAATVTWTGAAGTTDWNTAMNWDTGVPGSADLVMISGSSSIVDFSGTATVQTVTVAAGATLTVVSGVLTIDGSNVDHALETTGLTGTIINNGGIVITNTVGQDGIYSKGTFTNNGSITIDGTGGNGIYVAQGVFTNSPGATLSVTNSTSDYIRTDDNSGNTATFNNDGMLTIVVTTGDDGIYVNDGSTFNNASIINLSLGGTGGDESIFAEDGGIFNNNSGGVVTISSSQDMGIQTKLNGVINNNLGGTINIDAVDNDQIWMDATTSFTNSGILNLTNSGDVGLYVTDASTFTNTATGEVNITDATDHGIYVQGNASTATIDNSGTITVNGGGASSDGLRLNTGGSLTNNAGAFLYFNNTGADAIQIDPGTTLNNSGTISVDGTSSSASGLEEAMELNGVGSTFNNLTGGLYMVTNCADDGIEVNNGSIVNNDGAIRIDDSGGEDIETFTGFAFNNTANATFAPGSSPGDLTLKGSLDLGTSTTTFEINGLAQITDYDVIENFSGSILTVATATMHLDWGAYVPNVGDCFTVVDGSGTVSGTFGTVTSSNAAINYEITYPSGTDVVICIIEPLPVELVSFTGERSAKGAQLNWVTASELNNEGFDIERSSDSKEWTKLGNVRGKGTSAELVQYTYLDNAPLEGTNYYRLKQNDFDGRFDYSNIVSLNFENEKEGEFRIYPNPVGEVLNIELNQDVEDLEIQLYDSNGKLLWARNGAVNQIPFGNYSPGVYLLKIVSPLNTTVQKIINN